MRSGRRRSCARGSSAVEGGLGDVPGAPQEVESWVEQLIDHVGQDGGFLLSTSVVIDDSYPGDLHVLLGAGNGHGPWRQSGDNQT